ncbi:hypothetical protein SDJN02_16057, partial [Cucurbita argyrosperma subsp. argyrosperma]
MQGNDHYVYHNAAMVVAIPNGYPTSTTTRECSSDQKWVMEPFLAPITTAPGPAVSPHAPLSAVAVSASLPTRRRSLPLTLS